MTSFSVPNTFTPLTTISSSQMNANFTAVATAFAASLGIAGSETMTGTLKAASGSASAPGYTFGADQDIGIYRKAANSLGFSVAGTEHGYIDSSGNWVIPTGNFTITAGGLTLTAGDLTITAGDIVGLRIPDTAADHSYIFAAGEDATADRTLTLDLNDADRTLDVTGNTTLAGGTHSGTNTGDEVAASDTVAGVIEIAVQSEMEAASSTTLAVTPGRQLSHPAHTKAYGSYQSGLVDDFGITSASNTGTGDYDWNLATAMSSSDYGFCITSDPATINDAYVPHINGKTTTVATVIIANENGSQQNADNDIIIHGDQ